MTTPSPFPTMFDLWCLSSGNRIITTDDIVLVWSIARDLLDTDWSADELSLSLPDGRVLEGADLVEWLK